MVAITVMITSAHKLKQQNIMSNTGIYYILKTEIQFISGAVYNCIAIWNGE